MQFIKDGPDIPSECLSAQQDGKLIFFCGAGVSVPAGLPKFKQLVDRLICNFYPGGQNDDDFNKVMKQTYCEKRFDALIGLIEKEKGKRFVRNYVRNCFQIQSDPPLVCCPMNNLHK